MSEGKLTDRGSSDPMRLPVTIGMPVYNGAAYIEQALTGLVDQSYRNFTLHISDNASDDGTWEILEKWAACDDRIVLHRQTTNIGAMANFRYLLDCTETDLIMFHACDDWVAPNYLEEMVRLMASDPECALACSVAVIVEQDGKESKKDTFPPPIGATRLRRVKKLLTQPQATRIYGLFRIEALRRAQALGEEFGEMWSVDHLQLLELALNDRIRGTDRTSFYFRRGSPSGQRYRPKALSQRLRFIKRYWRFHLQLLGTSRLSTTEKIIVFPRLLVHLVRTQSTHPIRRFVKRPAKALLKTLFLRPFRTLTGRS